MSYQVHFCFAKNDRKKQKLQQNKNYSNYSIHQNSMSLRDRDSVHVEEEPWRYRNKSPESAYKFGK